MRRAVLAALVLAVAGSVVTPALATEAPPVTTEVPPVPVAIWQNSSGDICFGAFSWRPNCVWEDLLRPVRDIVGP